MFKNPHESQKRAMIFIRKTINIKHKKFINDYELNPKLCKECGKPILFEKRRNDFCGSNCSASYSNKRRIITWKKNTQLVPCKMCGTPTSKKSGFCSQGCYGRSIIKKHIDEGKGVGQDSLRRYLIFLRGHKCEECELESWRGEKISLESHHIDGNYSNNNLDNLKLLCPNCHSQTGNYKAKNKGNGRPYDKFR